MNNSKHEKVYVHLRITDYLAQRQYILEYIKILIKPTKSRTV